MILTNHNTTTIVWMLKECSSFFTCVDEALDHLETKTYELYDQRFFWIEMDMRTEGFECKKMRKNCEINQYLYGLKILFWSVPVPLIIKGAAPSRTLGLFVFLWGRFFWRDFALFGWKFEIISL